MIEAPWRFDNKSPTPFGAGLLPLFHLRFRYSSQKQTELFFLKRIFSL